jgi:hypothetical protein
LAVGDVAVGDVAVSTVEAGSTGYFLAAAVSVAFAVVDGSITVAPVPAAAPPPLRAAPENPSVLDTDLVHYLRHILPALRAAPPAGLAHVLTLIGLAAAADAAGASGAGAASVSVSIDPFSP